MLIFTSTEAQRRFSEIIDRAQDEPMEITPRGVPVVLFPAIFRHHPQRFADLDTDYLYHMATLSE